MEKLIVINYEQALKYYKDSYYIATPQEIANQSGCTVFNLGDEEYYRPQKETKKRA